MLISEQYLDKFETNSLMLLEERVLNEISKHFKSPLPKVFLSHKHDEIEILKKVIALFKSLEVEIYIDWLDQKMPKITSGETAEKIKERIIQSNKFILLATESAIASKWCNWELGFGDAKKYDKNIAIMPITKNDGNWVGNEYLEIYPAIKIEYEINKVGYYVEFKGEKTKLSEWLKQ